MSDGFQKRLVSYDKDHCWQYDIRINNFDQDLKEAFLNKEEAEAITLSDFSFERVVSKEAQQQMVEFIERHEWLGNISQMSSHWFAAYYNGSGFPKLAGVIIMNQPNAFSKMLVEDTPKLERLISRGACISWSPKHLASSFIMWCIRWMVKNTQYRLFTAYSDPAAKELGTIYQACNFYYLGNKFGGTERYVSPYSGKIVSDRYFRQVYAYKKYAEELGIIWDKKWEQEINAMQWENVPNDIEEKLREQSKIAIKKAEKILDVPTKHKYAYVLGENKQETKKLKKVFVERNKVYEYPKVR